jgi:hypothetical protein
VCSASSLHAAPHPAVLLSRNPHQAHTYSADQGLKWCLRTARQRLQRATTPQQRNSSCFLRKSSRSSASPSEEFPTSAATDVSVGAAHLSPLDLQDIPQRCATLARAQSTAVRRRADTRGACEPGRQAASTHVSVPGASAGTKPGSHIPGQLLVERVEVRGLECLKVFRLRGAGSGDHACTAMHSRAQQLHRPLQHASCMNGGAPSSSGPSPRRAARAAQHQRAGDGPSGAPRPGAPWQGSPPART